MVVLVIGWIVLSIVAGVLIGKGIHRADAVGFPARPESPSRELPTAADAALPAVDVSTQADGADTRDVVRSAA